VRAHTQTHACQQQTSQFDFKLTYCKQTNIVSVTPRDDMQRKNTFLNGVLRLLHNSCRLKPMSLAK